MTGQEGRPSDLQRREALAFYLAHRTNEDDDTLSTDSVLWMVEEGKRRRKEADATYKQRVEAALRELDAGASWTVNSANRQTGIVWLSTPEGTSFAVWLDQSLAETALGELLKKLANSRPRAGDLLAECERLCRAREGESVDGWRFTSLRVEHNPTDPTHPRFIYRCEPVFPTEGLPPYLEKTSIADSVGELHMLLNAPHGLRQLTPRPREDD